MSAPATNVRPAPIKTTARTDASCAARSIAVAMPSGTPALNALTGGLSTVIRPTPLSTLNLTSSTMNDERITPEQKRKQEHKRHKRHQKGRPSLVPFVPLVFLPPFSYR